MSVARRLALGLLLVMAAATAAAADTASLSGRVYDKTGGALPGVTITATNLATRARPP